MQRTNIHLPPSTRAALAKLSAQTGLPMAEHVRRALDAYLLAQRRKGLTQ